MQLPPVDPLPEMPSLQTVINGGVESMVNWLVHANLARLRDAQAQNSAWPINVLDPGAKELADGVTELHDALTGRLTVATDGVRLSKFLLTELAITNPQGPQLTEWVKEGAVNYAIQAGLPELTPVLMRMAHDIPAMTVPFQKHGFGQLREDEEIAAGLAAAGETLDLTF
jgi:hypothetical protein